MKSLIIIDGRRFSTEESAHTYLSKKPGFPPDYGKNLDALSEVLMSWKSDTLFMIKYSPAIPKNLGEYGQKLLQIFKDAEAAGTISLSIR